MNDTQTRIRPRPLVFGAVLIGCLLALGAAMVAWGASKAPQWKSTQTVTLIAQDDGSYLGEPPQYDPARVEVRYRADGEVREGTLADLTPSDYDGPDLVRFYGAMPEETPRVEVTRCRPFLWLDCGEPQRDETLYRVEVYVPSPLLTQSPS